jgi:hypothetical protein
MGTSAPPRSKRRLPRYNVDGTFRLRDRGSATVVNLVDVSLEGFCASLPAVPAPGALHVFDAAIGPPETLTLTAREVYAYPIEDRPGLYEVGWAWTDMSVNAEGAPIAVAELLDYLTAAESGVRLIEQDEDGQADGS